MAQTLTAAGSESLLLFFRPLLACGLFFCLSFKTLSEVERGRNLLLRFISPNQSREIDPCRNP